MRLEIINFITTVSTASEGLPLKKTLTPKQISSFDGYKKGMKHAPVLAKWITSEKKYNSTLIF